MLAVEVKDLVKTYDGMIRALDGVDLNIGAGKVFALLGPNGAGKTTLIRILTTQLRPDSGEAHVFGFDVVREGAEIRKIASYVPQEMSVWTDISGFENLLIYAKIYGVPSNKRRDIVEDALETMGLREVANNLVKTYSGGMIRRLEIACAMLTKPKIMFLDEPTIGLDPSARKAVWERLTSFRSEYGTTVFFNTHYMDEADLYSDEIAIINSGKIVKIGTTEELKHSVGGEAIRFTVENYAVAEDVLDRIRGISHVKDIMMRNSDLVVVVEDAESALPVVMQALKSEGVPVAKISTTKPTLDDVFLKYARTGLEAGTNIWDVRQVRRRIGRG
jgi:ABC-2 type transport system ATP-binding protein